VVLCGEREHRRRKRRPPEGGPSASPTTLKARLEGVGLLGVGEAGEGLRGAALVHFDFYGAFGFGTGLAEEGVGGDSFVVNLSDQIGFAGFVLFPDLADLNLARGHDTNVDRFDGGVNIAAALCFSGETPRKAAMNFRSRRTSKEPARTPAARKINGGCDAGLDRQGGEADGRR
jgi:hypothetical protein